MKKFVWRLQRVLEIKQSQLQSKRAELLGITEALAVKRTMLLTQQRILQQTINRIAEDKTKERLTKQQLLLKSSRVNERRIKALNKEVENLQISQKEKIAEFLKTKRFTEGLEKLREKAKKEFTAEQEKHEQKEMDERATLSFTRAKLKAESQPVG